MANLLEPSESNVLTTLISLSASTERRLSRGRALEAPLRRSRRRGQHPGSLQGRAQAQGQASLVKNPTADSRRRQAKLGGFFDCLSCFSGFRAVCFREFKRPRRRINHESMRFVPEEEGGDRAGGCHPRGRPGPRRPPQLECAWSLQGGIMSATTGLLLKQLEPSWRIVSCLKLQTCTEHPLDDFCDKVSGWLCYLRCPAEGDDRTAGCCCSGRSRPVVPWRYASSCWIFVSLRS